MGLFLTHQYLEQLSEEVRVAVFGNVGTVISFRIGAEDAAYVAKEFYPTFSQTDFINLPPCSMYIKLMIDGVTSKPFSAKTLPCSGSIYPHKEIIIQNSRENYSNINEQIFTYENVVDEAALF